MTVQDEATVIGIWGKQVWSDGDKLPTPPPVGKPYPDPPPEPHTEAARVAAWQAAFDEYARLDAAYDRAAAIAAALRATGANRAAQHRAMEVADALFNETAAAHRACARIALVSLG